MKLLFVCTAHVNRSVTAEELFKNSKRHVAKSAGIGFLAGVRVDEKLVRWADVIFVMDEENEGQKSFLVEKFRNISGIEKKIRVLEIEDRYAKNSPELKAELRKKIKKYIDF